MNEPININRCLVKDIVALGIPRDVACEIALSRPYRNAQDLTQRVNLTSYLYSCLSERIKF